MQHLTTLFFLQRRMCSTWRSLCCKIINLKSVHDPGRRSVSQRHRRASVCVAQPSKQIQQMQQADTKRCLERQGPCLT